MVFITFINLWFTGFAVAMSKQQALSFGTFVYALFSILSDTGLYLYFGRLHGVLTVLLNVLGGRALLTVLLETTATFFPNWPRLLWHSSRGIVILWFSFVSWYLLVSFMSLYSYVFMDFSVIGLVMMVLSAPVWISSGFLFVITVIDFGMFFLTGNWSYLLDVQQCGRRVYRNFYLPLRDSKGLMRKFLFAPGVSFVWLAEASIILPTEIITHISSFGLSGYLQSNIYFVVRVVLFFWVFVALMLGFWLLLIIPFIIFIVLAFALICFIYYTRGFDSIWYATFACVFFFFRGLLPMFIIERVNRETYHLYRKFLESAVRFRSYINEVIYKRPLSVRGANGRLVFITPEISLSPIYSGDLHRLLGDELLYITRLAGPYLLLYCIIYFGFYLPIRKYIIRRSRTILYFPFKVINSLFYASFVFMIPSSFFDIAFLYAYNGFLLYRANIEHIGTSIDKFCKMIGLAWVYGSEYAKQLNYDNAKPEFNRLSQLFVRSSVTLTRVAVLRFVEYMDNVRLPELIQAQYKPPTIDSIRNTLVFLKGMSFPVDQSVIDTLHASNTSPYLAEWGSFRDRIMGRSNIALGFRKIVRTGMAFWLPDDFYPEIPGFIHSATFTGVAEEILATSRYWNDKEGETSYHLPGFDEAIDDLWETVKVQYGNSRLATFNEIYSMWVKKYNMGFGFVTPQGKKLKSLTRQAVINSMGGKKPFLSAWAKVFYNAKKLVLPSPVFTKYETLKLKKALARSPRTVIGASFIEYVLASVFAYKPNHNYQYWSTPMKVGMPITGRSFDKLWCSLLGHEQIRAGDCTAFDSSQRPFMVKIVAEIRKKGYTFHKDYHAICQIIDHVYQGLIDQPMAFRAFGDIASKGKGFTTGHTSTTPDNSLALVCNYLMAWRMVTGLRAREFLNFNTLANFGDDHVISFDPVFGWSPEAGWKEMGKWGTIVRDEAPGEYRLPDPRDPVPSGGWDSLKFAFLSKKPLPMTPDVRAEIDRAGIIHNMTFGTFHDKEKLIGKMKGHNLLSGPRRHSTLDISEAEKRREYTRALSYLSLCAHHKDIYDKLIYEIHSMWVDNKEQWAKDGFAKSCKKPPSYNQVLRNWYKEGLTLENKNEFVLEGEQGFDEDNDNYITVIENPDPFGVFIRWLSDAPTLFSPRYRNIRWADWLQNKLHFELSWPHEFIAKANGVRSQGTVNAIISKTPYSFLRNSALSGNGETPFGVLLFRNWIFMLYQRFVVPRRYGFSFLDMVRILDHGFVTGLFLFTGRVTQVLVELDLHIIDTFIIYLLSFVNFDTCIPPLGVSLPAPSDLLGQFISWVFRIMQPSGAIDFQSLDAKLSLLRSGYISSFRFSAPTGTGKSTRMVNRIQNAMNRPVVVIVPRRQVALGLASYMQTLYPHSGITASCEGGDYEPGSRIIYTTAQSFFMHPEFQLPDTVIFFDECHINEPHYNVVHSWAKQSNNRIIYCTATPPDHIEGIEEVVVPAVSSFNISSATHTFNDIGDYLHFAADFINSRSTWERSIVFVPTLKNAYSLQDLLQSSSAIVSSKDDGASQDVTTYICTSTADAGLTIPDVVFVFSPDYDVTVTNTGARVDPRKPYFYRIDNLTKLQRRGRTGRTSDGTFVWCHITSVECSTRSYSFWDYIDSMNAGVQSAYAFFPDSIKAQAPNKFEIMLPLFTKIELVIPAFPKIVQRLSSMNPMLMKRYIQSRYNGSKDAFGISTLSGMEPAPTDGDNTPFDQFGETFLSSSDEE